MPDSGTLTRTSPTTLNDAINAVAAMSGLSDTSRRDYLSAIGRFCELTGRTPATILANPAAIRALMTYVNPVAHGLSRKTWANIRSNLRAALKASGMLAQGTRGYPLAPAYRALYDRLPSKRLRDSLVGLMRYASERGVLPELVGDDIVLSFMAQHKEMSCNRRPNAVHRRICMAWNEAAASIEDWPAIRLTVPDFHKPRRHLAWEELPDGLRRDIEAYLSWLSGDDDLFADKPPPHVCRPTTIKGRRTLLRCAASAALQGGVAPDQLRSLADLVKPEVVKVLLKRYRELLGGRVTQGMVDLTELLISVARNWVRPAVDLEPLRFVLKELVKRAPRQSGLTEKNRQMLRQFDDRQCLARYLHLPETLLTLARKGERIDGRGPAILVQLALAIGILQTAPMRISNLAALRLDAHVARPDGPKGAVHLIIPGDETKNEQPLHYPLPQNMTSLFDFYLTRVRPALGADTPWVFPGENGQHKLRTTLAAQITGALDKHGGLAMTPHQFRHLAAKLLLDANPGALELVRRLLGHKDIKTTIRFYAEFDMRRAAQYFDETILKLRRDNPR